MASKAVKLTALGDECKCGHSRAAHYPHPWGCVLIIKRKPVTCCPCDTFKEKKANPNDR